MIISHKQQAYPVPGVEFDGRRLFLEIKAGDGESTMKIACSMVETLIMAGARVTKTKCVKTKTVRPVEKTVMEN